MNDFYVEEVSKLKEFLYEKNRKFLTWFGDIYFATKPPLCKAKQIEGMLQVISAGDIICRGYNYYLDSFFIPGEYSHSGIVLNCREMVHSVAEGVGSIHPIDFVKDTDRFIVIRPKYKNNYYSQRVIERAIWHVDANMTQYDFTFSDPNKFYCHEFVVDCLNSGMIFPRTSVKKFGVGIFSFEKRLYLAKDLINIGNVLYEFKGGNS
jgi:hypothetical protein